MKQLRILSLTLVFFFGFLFSMDNNDQYFDSVIVRVSKTESEEFELYTGIHKKDAVLICWECSKNKRTNEIKCNVAYGPL